MLRSETIALKTDLINKYEEIRKNNEQMFKNYELKNQQTLKKLKQKYESKISHLSAQLAQYEEQEKLQNTNHRSRNE